jgi:hypothetical protein
MLNGAIFTFGTNDYIFFFRNIDTWRGIQNSLTSSSTSESLAAAQGKVLKELADTIQAQANYNSNQGVKNLFRITAESQTINGVTFTVDKVAGTVTANGTSTSQIAFKLTDYLSTSILQVGNTYILSGCPAGGNYTSTYALYVFNAGTSNTVWVDVGLSGGSSYVIPSDIRLSPLHILIRSGVTCNNLVFKPMIRDASIKDDTFEPYAMSNAELTQKALIKEDDNAGGYDITLDKPFTLRYGFYAISISNRGIELDSGGDIVSIKSDGIYFNGNKVGP